VWLSFSCVMYDLSFGNEPIVQIVTVLSLARFISSYARERICSISASLLAVSRVGFERPIPE